MILAKDRKLLNQCNSLGGFPQTYAFIIETPILWSCYSGQYEFFKWLLSEKAEVRIVSENITTCLIGACLGPEPSRAVLVKHILKLSVPLSPLPCRFPKLLDIQDVDGQTALHVAASVGNAACVKLLLDAGADSTLRDAEGLTPLQVGFPRGCEWQQAEKSCFPECAEMLEAKWKELEERAREEMEELLRMEGFDPKEWAFRRESEGQNGEKGEEGKEEGEEAGQGARGGERGEHAAQGVSVRSVSQREGHRGRSRLLQGRGADIGPILGVGVRGLRSLRRLLPAREGVSPA